MYGYSLTGEALQLALSTWLVHILTAIGHMSHIQQRQCVLTVPHAAMGSSATSPCSIGLTASLPDSDRTTGSPLPTCQMESRWRQQVAWPGSRGHCLVTVVHGGPGVCFSGGPTPTLQPSHEPTNPIIITREAAAEGWIWCNTSSLRPMFVSVGPTPAWVLFYLSSGLRSSAGPDEQRRTTAPSRSSLTVTNSHRLVVGLATFALYGLSASLHSRPAAVPPAGPALSCLVSPYPLFRDRCLDSAP